MCDVFFCKNRIFRLMLCFLVFCGQVSIFAQSLYVGTYNIRYQNQSDAKSGDAWENRCPVVCAQLNFEHPDIFGAQEVLVNQLEDMLGMLDGYAYIGCGRDDGKEAGEYAPIFYDPKVLNLLDSGTFWLSEQPDVPSKGWDAALNRICTWGLFEQKVSGFVFYFFNLHMDHQGVKARKESAKLVLKRILQGREQGRAVVLAGDFNVNQHDEAYAILAESSVLTDCFTTARLRFAENGTYMGYNQKMLTESRIDHVFVTSEFQVDRYGILTNGYWKPSGKKDHHGDWPKAERHLPSDHYPVFVHLIGK